MAAKSTAKPAPRKADEIPARERILDAAFSAFMERGFAETSTLEIATRARVSKRELYALVGSKQEMLAACIGERAKRLQMPAGLPRTARSRNARAHARDPGNPALARNLRPDRHRRVSPGDRRSGARARGRAGPELARRRAQPGRLARDDEPRPVGRAAPGEPAEMAEHFAGLLWGNLMTGLLLRTAERPAPREIARRAGEAAAGLLQLYAKPAGLLNLASPNNFIISGFPQRLERDRS